MSRPLDPARAYGDFVLVSPDLGHPPAVVVKDDSLCIGGLGFTDRKVTLLRGLPDKAGDTLADNADVDFTFGEKPLYVGFAGEGVILPREDSDGVGIETINVTRLAVEVWRVPDRNLVRKSISAPAPTAEGDYAEDYGDDSPDDEGRVVWKGLVSVKADPGARATTVFPLGAVLKSMAPGGYVIKARDASGGRAVVNKDGGEDETPAQARRWVIFTDMALTSFTGSRSLDVVVRSLKTAHTLSGLPVALVARDGETLATVRTGSDGRATFPHALLQGDGAATPKMVMAYGPAGDLAVLDLERSPIDLTKQAGPGHASTDAAADITAGRTPKTAIDGYLYADRGIYRPGEKAHLTALVRDDQSRAVDDRAGYIEVLRPSGVEFRRYAFKGSGGGAVLADVVLPAASPREVDGGAARRRLRRSGRLPHLQRRGFCAPAPGGHRRRAPGYPDRGRGDARRRRHRPLPLRRDRLGPEDAGRGAPARRSRPLPALRRLCVGRRRRRVPGTIRRPRRHRHRRRRPRQPRPAGRQGRRDRRAAAGRCHRSVFEPGGRPVRETVGLKLRTKSIYLGVKVDESAASGDRAPPVSLNLIAVDQAGRRVVAKGQVVMSLREIAVSPAGAAPCKRDAD
jgi:uncharacterized protein YfaS (alpha-2-macroglobulin family)